MTGVLRQPFVAHLGEAKSALHHTEYMLNLGAGFGLSTITGSLHPFDPNRVSADPLWFRVEWLNSLASTNPGQGIMASVSSRNLSLRVFFRYFSKLSVKDCCFISVSRSREYSGDLLSLKS